MLSSYFKIALRTLRRRKGYVVLNVAGLAVGLAAVLLIGLWVQDELSYDDFHENSERTYRILREFDIPDLKATIDVTPPALAAVLEEGVLEVEHAVRTDPSNAPTVESGTQRFVEPGFLWADAGFFEIFDGFEMKRGAANLDRPGTVVLSEAMAAKYFPGERPVGETVQVDDRTLEVTGVMREVSSNSSLRFDFVGSMATREVESNWDYNNFVTYVMLREGAAKRKAASAIDDVITANMHPEAEQEQGGYGDGDPFIPHLQPLTGIHLGTGVPIEIASAGNPLYVWLFGALAGFVLLLACINFTNLATARSMERAGEVGIRKALGAQREHLAGQFLGEALLLSSAATLLAVLLARTGLPLLNALSGKELALGPILASPWVLVLPALALTVALVAGAYPALALSRFESAEVLRGSYAKGRGGRRFRQGLVIFQFVVSIALLAGTAIVCQQLHFMQSAGLGFEEENLVVVERADRLGDQREAFMQEVAQASGVEAVTSALDLPGMQFINSMWVPSETGVEPRNMNYSYVGEDYLQTLGIETVVGQAFGPSTPDTFAVMLNEAAARGFGWTPEEAVGKGIQRGPYEFNVVGVTKDFHYESLHSEIHPLLLFPPVSGRQDHVVARISPQDLPATLVALRSTWKQFSDLPFEYSFLADDLSEQYRAESRMAKVFAAGALLAIVVACLGLFGLTAFAAERRTKEIAVRKALGASASNLVGLLSKDFLKLVAVGFLIAVPLAWYGMHQWLTGFAYRIDLGPLVFLGAGALALLVALATVSAQALRAARLSPVQALRDD